MYCRCCCCCATAVCDIGNVGILPLPHLLPPLPLQPVCYFAMLLTVVYVCLCCRNFIKRYAEILKGRLTLELLYLPGIEGKVFEELGERALCYALELAIRIESLNQYSFVPKDLLHTMNRTLFSSGDLISALMNLSIKRVDAFFEELQSLPPSNRSKKLLDMVMLPNEILRGLKEDLKNEEYFHLVLKKVIALCADVCLVLLSKSV